MNVCVETVERTYLAAIDEAIAEEMERDERVILVGTNPPPGLVATFGPARVRRTPISEPAFTGMAVGAAASGLRPIVWWRNSTFGFVAFDQVVNQAAKMRYMFGGQCDLPIVFRATIGGGSRMAAQHSQSPYALYAHVPGLKIAVPSDPATAKGLLKTAIRDDNPVLMFEPSRCEGMTGPVATGDAALMPFGVAATKREGRDVLIVAIGYMVQTALAASEGLALQGIEAEVMDPRTLVPLDFVAIREAALRLRRVVIVDEAPVTCSMASEIAASLSGDPAVFRALAAPIARVTGASVPIPYSPPLEDFVLPSPERIEAAVRSVLVR